jgi:uncharacterized protein (TIGR03083 family)
MDAMDPTRTTDLLEETLRATIAVGRELSDEEWESPTDCPAWTAKDHVSHLIGTERMLQGLPSAEVEADVEPWPHVKNPIGEFNEREVELRRGRSGSEVLAELEELVELRLGTLRNADEAYFTQEAMTPTGPGTMLDFLSIRILDCWVHEQDIRRAVGRPGHLDGGPAEHTTDRLLRTIPIVVGKRAAAPEGSVTLLRLTGPVERTVPVVVEGGRAKVADPDTAGPPDVTVAMDSETFLVLAVGRQAALDRSDRIEISGEGDWGQAVVDQLNMMI